MRRSLRRARAALPGICLLVLVGGLSGQALYDSSSAMIPMRDGVRLHTIIWRPRGRSTPLPILLERTPYNAAGCRGAIARSDALRAEGYIFVCQDIRGKYGSEGTFVMIRPTLAPGAPGVDETTDAWDTIDWLVGNVPEGNGRVGVWGLGVWGQMPDG